MITNNKQIIANVATISVKNRIEQRTIVVGTFSKVEIFGIVQFSSVQFSSVVCYWILLCKQVH